MASGVEELLDMLFDMVDEAKNVPLSSDKCMIERDRALDLIDDIRAQFPVELSEAKKLMASRADMIASAKREADAIRRQAEEKAKQMLAEESILLQARQRANELMQQAEDRSRELKRSANDYCPAPHRGGGGRGVRRDQKVPLPLPRGGQRRPGHPALRRRERPPHVRRGGGRGLREGHSSGVSRRRIDPKRPLARPFFGCSVFTPGRKNDILLRF